MHLCGITGHGGGGSVRVARLGGLMQLMCINDSKHVRRRHACASRAVAASVADGGNAAWYERRVVAPPARGYGPPTMQGVEFQGFAGDCTIAGKITMFGERLTDFLNGQERFRVHHVEFTSLADGHVLPMDSVSVEREDLLLVVGTGPRGSEKERVSLEQARMQLSIGPYMLLGDLHIEPGSDPIKNVMQREPMIPLTNATIAYSVAGAVLARDVGTVIVNRLLVEWISATEDEASIFPEATVRSPFSMNLRKDFTGPATL